MLVELLLPSEKRWIPQRLLLDVALSSSWGGEALVVLIVRARRQPRSLFRELLLERRQRGGDSLVRVAVVDLLWMTRGRAGGRGIGRGLNNRLRGTHVEYPRALLYQ